MRAALSTREHRRADRDPTYGPNLRALLESIAARLPLLGTLERRELMPGEVIAVDPGTRQCGYAVFVGGAPVYCGLVKSKASTVETRAIDMAVQLLEAYALSEPLIVVERPVIYPDRRERDNDIVDLALTAGIVGGALAAAGGVLLTPTPRAWKGSVPKHVHNERTAARCPAAVELVNELPKGQRNHVYDAVGLALWGMERIGK
jgi:hypothetical protein